MKKFCYIFYTLLIVVFIGLCVGYCNLSLSLKVKDVLKIILITLGCVLGVFLLMLFFARFFSTKKPFTLISTKITLIPAKFIWKISTASEIAQAGGWFLWLVFIMPLSIWAITIPTLIIDFAINLILAPFLYFKERANIINEQMELLQKETFNWKEYGLS